MKFAVLFVLRHLKTMFQATLRVVVVGGVEDQACPFFIVWFLLFFVLDIEDHLLNLVECYCSYLNSTVVCSHRVVQYLIVKIYLQL